MGTGGYSGALRVLGVLRGTESTGSYRGVHGGTGKY